MKLNASSSLLVVNVTTCQLNSLIATDRDEHAYNLQV